MARRTGPAPRGCRWSKRIQHDWIYWHLILGVHRLTATNLQGLEAQNGGLQAHLKDSRGFQRHLSGATLRTVEPWSSEPQLAAPRCLVGHERVPGFPPAAKSAGCVRISRERGRLDGRQKGKRGLKSAGFDQNLKLLAASTVAAVLALIPTDGRCPNWSQSVYSQRLF